MSTSEWTNHVSEEIENRRQKYIKSVQLGIEESLKSYIVEANTVENREKMVNKTKEMLSEYLEEFKSVKGIYPEVKYTISEDGERIILEWESLPL